MQSPPVLSFSSLLWPAVSLRQAEQSTAGGQSRTIHLAEEFRGRKKRKKKPRRYLPVATRLLR